MCWQEIHKVLSFTQSAGLAPYINFDTERRKLAVNSFTKDIYKLMSNAVSTSLLICYFEVDIHSAFALIRHFYMTPYTLYWINDLSYLYFTLIHVNISWNFTQVKIICNIYSQVFGKTIENTRHHVDMRLTTDAKQAKRLIAKPYFESFKIINKDLTLVTLSKTEVEMNKPIAKKCNTRHIEGNCS